MKWNKQLFAATLLLANSVLLPIVAIAENNPVTPFSEMIEKEEKQEKNSKNETEGEKKETTTESSSEASKEAAVSSEIPVTPEITSSSEEISAVENEEKTPEGGTNAEVETDAGTTTTNQEVRLADWETEDKGSYVLITKYTGSSTEIVVPNEIDGKPTKLKDIDSKVFPNLSSATSFKILPQEDGTKVGVESTDLSNAFEKNKSLKTIDLTGLDTSNVTNMAYMFYKCEDTISLNVRGWNTSNVTNMAYTFAYMKSLPELDVSSFDTSNVTNMAYTFAYMKSLPELDVSSFDTSNVTNMSHMFYFCASIAEINVSNFNTKNVTDIERMFANMPKIICLDVSSFDLSSTALDRSGFFDIVTLDIYVPKPVTSAVIATDPKFFSSSYWAGYRLPFDNFPILDANGGVFNDFNFTSEMSYANAFVITPEKNKIATFEQFKKENIPTNGNKKFLGWKLAEGDDTNATNVVPDLIGTKYLAQWSDASVKVKYVFEDTEKEIHEAKEILGNIGEAYDATTEEFKLNIDGYVLDESRLPENATGTFTKEPQEIVYYYKAAPLSLVNGSFEDPVISSPSLSPRGYYWQAYSSIPGWKTTGPYIELQKAGPNWPIPAVDGNQWTELNYDRNAALYQDIKTTPGDTLYWEVYHRGTDGTDTAAVEIGKPDGQLVEQTQMTTSKTAWKKYSGLYTVPEGQTMTRFQMRTIRSGSSIDPASYANSIDHVVFTNITSQIKVNFVDEKGASIKEPQIIKGYKDQSYDLTDIVKTSIPGYKIDESKIPEGITGTFTDEDKEITLVYKPLDIHIPSEGEDNKKPEELSSYGIAYLPKQFQTERTMLNDSGSQSIPVNKTSRFDVGVRDLQNTINQWTLTAQLVWNEGKELLGSSIKTTNKSGLVMKNVNSGTDPFDPETDLTDSNNEVQGGTDVTITNVPIPIMTANNVSHNAVYNYNLGDVSLEIPDARVVQPGSYEGYVEWNLSNVL
ncbi:BspA family leucine-rich repeat surface protein [Enterococcus faecalis]|uniref:BspA family leucine-rich repeat surface protein n=1 Tax=Enterococcus faecalis TaxID=1351 RepID=UPI001A97BBE8|nr:BspA family leucine-rich repeat surface protein [Enterococcus faecalis]MBO1104236.1 BspA family leucine-rich repeat surface protein [Enterococcus faecalis]